MNESQPWTWKDFIGPGATVFSGIIIAVGASCAARTFQPMFVGEARFL